MPRPFIPVPHAMEGVIHAHAPQLMSPSVMTFGFWAENASPDAVDCTAVLEFLIAWVEDSYKPLVCESVIFDDITVRSLASNIGPEVGALLNEPATGGSGRIGAMSILTLLKSDAIGRSFNGRSYGFFPPDSVIDAGFWSATYVTQIEGAYTDLRSRSITATYPLAIVSRKLQQTTFVSTLDALSHFSYQTRRDPNRL